MVIKIVIVHQIPALDALLEWLKSMSEAQAKIDSVTAEINTTNAELKAAL